MNRMHKMSVSVLALGLSAATAARADELPGKHIATFSIHAEPGDPNTDLLFTITLYVTPVARSGDSINWHVTKVGIEDFAGDRTWLDTIPSGQQVDWWITHAAPLHPAEGEFADTGLLSGIADATSGGSADLEYAFHTEGGSAAYVNHAWWELQIQEGETCGKDDDKPIVLSADVDPE